MFQATHYAQKSGLAAAVCAYDGDFLAFFNAQAEINQCPDIIVVAVIDPVYSNDVFHGFPHDINKKQQVRDRKEPKSECCFLILLRA
jgi:hypothetical protein